MTSEFRDKDYGVRIMVNGMYIDPCIPYNKKKTYICARQGGIIPGEEKLGIPLVSTYGMVLIYDIQHMEYKSIAFASVVDGSGKAWPTFKPVLAPCDGTLKLVKGTPAMDIDYGILMFDNLVSYELKSYKKGEVMGEVSSVDQLKGSDGIKLTCYKSLDGEVFYLPSVYFNITWIE